MSILTKEVQIKFIEENFNKPVVYSSNIGRLAGYIETKKGFFNIISFGYGHKEPLIYIDAGLRLTFIELENPLFQETNQLLSLNGNPERDSYIFQNMSDNILFNTSGLDYLKNHTLSLFNKIVHIDNNIVRLIGYSKDDFGNSYIALNINNEKKYFDSLCRVKEVTLSEDLASYIDSVINKAEDLVFEDLQSEE